MHTRAALGVLALAHDLGDGHGGSVGAQDAVVPDDLAQLLEGGALQVQDLGGGLDNHIAVLHAGQLHGGADVGHGGLHGLLGGFTGGHTLLQAGAHLGQGVVAELLLDVPQDHLVALGGGDLSNTGTHLAGAQDADRLDSHVDQTPL